MANVGNVITEVLRSHKLKLDRDTQNYLVEILRDPDGDTTDLEETIIPLLSGALDTDEEKAGVLWKEIFQKLKRGDAPKKQETKLLNAPILLSKLTEQQEQQVNESMKLNLAIKLNYTPISLGNNESVIGLEALQDADALLAQLRNAKKEIRKDRKQQNLEVELAKERDEILHKISNKPIKLHSLGVEGSRTKDIKLENVSMALFGLELLEDVSLIISHGRKYGVIGRNGIGKTTFLKHLADHAFPGVPKHLQILHIEQEVTGSNFSALETVLATDFERENLLQEGKILQNLLDEATQAATTKELQTSGDKFKLLSLSAAQRSDRLIEVFDRLQEIESDRAVSEASAILHGLGFTDETMNWSTKNFSGGWRMRISLAQALFISPDVLLLDEPTNHLDLHSVIWLEAYLKNWKKTLLIVSHDRDFLNEVTTDTLHFYNKTITKYRGNYDTFEQIRLDSLKQQERAHDAQEKKIAHIQKYIDKNRVRAATAKMAQSRIKKLARMEVIPEVANDPLVKISIPEAEQLQGSLVRLSDISFGYSPDKLLYSGINCTIDIKSRVALVGANGVGKSTLLKLMYGDLQPVSGHVEKSAKVRIARFTQHHMDQLDLTKTPLQWFQSMYPKAKHQEIRKHLGNVGITGNLALQPIYSLSGGQKSRVAFSNIIWLKPHIILLDEPTNHLDMDTIDALIRALNDWNGGVLMVSHDEHIISTVCDEVWVCENRRIIAFNGDFADYKQSLVSRYFSKNK